MSFVRNLNLLICINAHLDSGMSLELWMKKCSFGRKNIDNACLVAKENQLFFVLLD